VHAILQTRDGYIWAATEGGLARFDGLRFVVYNSQNTPGLRTNNIRSMFEDREGTLWIATADGVARLKNSTFTTFTIQQGLPSNNVWSLYQERDGDLWVVTAQGLARFRGNGFEVSADPGATSPALTGAITEDNQGTLWVGTRSGLRVLKKGSLIKPSFPRRLSTSDVEALISDRSGRLWIGTQNGLYALEKSTVTPARGLPGHRITVLYQDRSGSIWVGTDAGLGRIANGKVTRASASDPLLGSMILSIYEDREGSVWIGTELSGIGILRDQKFTTYASREDVGDDLVRCVFGDSRGTVWMGTNEKGLVRYENGRFSSITTADGLSSNVILALAEDRDGSLLVGTPDGLNRIRRGEISILTSADGLADDFVRSILSDGHGSLWIGTRRGLSRLKNGRFTTYTQADGLGSDLVGALLEDGPDELWIGTLHGLTRLANGRLKNYTTADGLSSDVITALYKDSDGILWIGSEGGGLSEFRNGRFIRIPAELRLPQVIYGIAEDITQNLWFSSDSGIFRANRTELDRFAHGKRVVVPVVSYGASDGLRIGESSGGGHPAAWKAKNGALWFATLKGVAILRSDAKLNRLPPPVAIESVSIDDQVFDPAKIDDIDPGHSRFAFEYAGLSFVAPQKVRFRYKLEGFDRNWVEAGTRRVAYYTNLRPGSYRFRVLARNNDGFWNESGSSLEFRLEPHFYQTYWFFAFVALAIGLLSYSIYRWRVRQVEAQFNAVLQERNRIAREIHDTLAQGFAGVSVQLEIVARLLSSSADAAREHLDQARLLVRHSLTEARRSIWELRSQSSESEDLAARLSKMAAQASGSTQGKVKLQVHGTYRPLTPKMEDELLKIAQEALTNALRHAEAENINIVLTFDAKKLRMTIADDGRGFQSSPYAGWNGHFGLQGMRERAENIDAELSVDTGIGKGTRVSVEALVN
jgi:ligand-binding sensor domain-containing protein/signal transduction histidine kinase